MKKIFLRSMALAASIFVTIIFTVVLLAYVRPMENKIYNLALGALNDGETWDGDEKGWKVFAQSKDTVSALVPNEVAGYTGELYPGQTFYLSRVLTEELDSPILSLGTADRNFAVFLDDELLYTDCPHLDNRIGYLELPMHEYDRPNPLELALPSDYHGRTLTIAQSTPPESEKQFQDTTEVFPCSVRIYCGYAYESTLISESFQTALPASALFIAGILLLFAFLWTLFHDRVDLGLFFFALFFFLQSTGFMSQTSFFSRYFPDFPVKDVLLTCRLHSLASLFGFLFTRFIDKTRFVFLIFFAGQIVSSVLIQVLPLSNPWYYFPAYWGLLGLVLSFIFSAATWKKASLFCRLYALLSLSGILLYLAALCLSPVWAPDWGNYTLKQLHISMDSGIPDYFLWKLIRLVMSTSFISILADILHTEFLRHSAESLLEQKREITISSYMNLRQHNEEVMMLRHDMMKHFSLLRHMAQNDSPQITAYLDELIEKNRQIHPVFESGNEILDIILNGRLGSLNPADIKVEIIRCQAPQKLPLSDSKLCSLFMNLIDNAITAASASKMADSFIRLDLHVKNDYFVFRCENSVSNDHMKKEAHNEIVQKHGLGLKIVRQILSPLGNLMQTEYSENTFKVTVALPLTGQDN